MTPEHYDSEQMRSVHKQNFEEILADSQTQLLKEVNKERMTTYDLPDDYNSACHQINPRLEKEIIDRERRIKALLQKNTQDEEEEI
jgi:hypothetical protein